MIRLALWCFVAGTIAYLFVIGPVWPALVVGGVGILLLIVAEVDEWRDHQHGWFRR